MAMKELGVAASVATDVPTKRYVDYDPSLNVYNWKASNTRKLRSSLALARAGVDTSNQLFIGDSETDNYTGTANDQLHMWPLRYRDALAGMGVPRGGDGFVRAGGRSGAVDPRWIFTGTWTNTIVAYATGNANGSTATFTMSNPATSIDVWYGDTSGTLSVSIDGAVGGAGFSAITPGGTSAWVKVSYTGLSNTVHTVKVTQTSTTAILLKGVNSFNSSGLLVHNMGENGLKASDWVILTPFTTAEITAEVVLPPASIDVVFCALGVNDAIAARTPAAIVADLTTLRNRWSACDFVLVAQYQPSTVALATWQAYVTALYTLADTLDVPLIDLLDRSGGYTVAAANGLMGDTIHPNAAAQRDWGGTVALIASSLDAPSDTTATANTLVLRDSSGRAQVTTPAASADAANKGYVDAQGRTVLLVSTTVNPAVAGGYYMCDATSGAFTVTLPSAPIIGAQVLIQKVDSSANLVSYIRGGTDTIEGSTSALTLADNDAVELTYGASGIWYLRRFIASPTPGTTMRRDESGRSQVVSPAVSADIATKGYVDAQDAKQGLVSVLDWGISPSNTAATNTAAWTALMAVVPDNSVVYFPANLFPYDFSAVCAIPSGKHLKILGGDGEKSLIRTTSATADIFTVGDWNNCFEGLKFMSSVTRSGGAAINSGNNVGVVIIDCDFLGMWDGIVFTGGSSAGNLAAVSRCNFAGTLNRGIVVDGANANAVIDTVVMDGTSGVQQIGLELLQCGSLLVSNCDFIRAVNNCRFNPVSPNGVFSVYFVNTFFDTSPNSSLKFANTGNVQRVKFINCWFSGSNIGVDFSSTASTLPTGIDFVSCDIFSNSNVGIYANAVQDFSVDTCRIAGNTTAGIHTVASASSVTKFRVINSTIGPTGGVGANGTGINIASGTYGGYSIIGNDVRGNTSGNITDAGTVASAELKNIDANLGHRIKGAIGTRGTTSVTSGTGDTALLTVTVPINSVAVGSTFRVKLIGLSSSTGTLIFRVHAGAAATVSDATVWQSITSAAQVQNQRAGFDGLLTVRSVGGSGTVACEALGYAQAANLPTLVATATTPTVVTTANWFITLSATCSSGTFTALVAEIEAI